MKLKFIDISPQQAVTILRFLYPIWAMVGMFSLMYVPSTLIVAQDAAVTARNIVTNELLFRAGIAGSLVTQLIHIWVVLVLYQLFKSVNKKQARLVVILGLVGVPIAMLNTLNRVAALLLTSGSGYLSAFEPAQLQALMMFFLDLNEQGMVIASIFWGLWLLPQGYLIYKSGYFPKIFGVLMFLAGIGYFVSAFTQLLLPSFGAISSGLEILTFGEVIFMVWVMFMGAKLPKMKGGEQSG